MSMPDRVSRGYAALAVLLAVQVVLVLVYLWPWPGFGKSASSVTPNQAAAVADVTMIAGLPTVAGDPALAVPDAPDVPVGGGPAPVSSLTIETSIDRGAAVAAEWEVDAPMLVGVQMQIDWPQNEVPETVTAIVEGGWLRYYYFDAGGDVPSTLFVLIERTSGEVRETRVEPMAIFGEDGVDPTQVEVWDTAAVLAVEMLGGTAFRAACPTEHFTTIVTLRFDPGTNGPVWDVEYTEFRDNPDPLVARVDAITGEATIISPGNTDC